MGRKRSSQMASTINLIYVNMVLYALCYQMQRPLEPFLVDTLVKSKSDGLYEYAKLQAFFSAFQMVGSLFIGRLIDRIGFRGGFYLNFLASALSYYLLSESKSLPILYMSKIPTIFQAGFLCAQVAVSKSVSDGKVRVEALGRLTTAYTVGSIIGPFIGGVLGTTGDYYYGARIAVVGSILSIFITFLTPEPPTYDTPSSDDSEKDDAKDSRGQTMSILEVAMSVWLLLGTKVISNVANSMSQSAMPLVLKDTFFLNEYNLGVSMAVMSGFNAFVSGFAMGPIVSLASGNLRMIISASLVFICLTFVGQAVCGFDVVRKLSFNGGFYEYFGLSLLGSMGQYVLANTLLGESTQVVAENHRGTLIGLEHSVFAAARILAPQSGVYLLLWGGVSGISAGCAVVYLSICVGWELLKGDSLPIPDLYKKVETEVKET